MNEEELQFKKEKAMKCKVISLDLLHHSPLANPTFMNARDKKKIIKMMETWFEKPDAEVNEEFNDIVNNKILDGKTDLSTFSCPEIHFCE